MTYYENKCFKFATGATSYCPPSPPMPVLRLTEFPQNRNHRVRPAQVVWSQSVKGDQQHWLLWKTAGGRDEEEEEEIEGWVVDRQPLHSNGLQQQKWQVLTLQDTEPQQQRGPRTGPPPTGSHLEVTQSQLHSYILLFSYQTLYPTPTKKIKKKYKKKPDKNDLFSLKFFLRNLLLLFFA